MMEAKPAMHLGSFPDTSHDNHDRPSEWKYGSNGDGTYYASNGVGGEREDFPTEGESMHYAKFRAQGLMHLNALMKLMKLRVQITRAAHTRASKAS
jgi:hypothetical protein